MDPARFHCAEPKLIIGYHNYFSKFRVSVFFYIFTHPCILYKVKLLLNTHLTPFTRQSFVNGFLLTIFIRNLIFSNCTILKQRPNLILFTSNIVQQSYWLHKLFNVCYIPFFQSFYSQNSMSMCWKNVNLRKLYRKSSVRMLTIL